MNISQDNQPFVNSNEEALEIYNASINKPTSVQRHCVEKLKSLYKKYLSDDVANFYAKALFNLSLRVPVTDMQKIFIELEKLFQTNPTEDIAGRIGRLKYNLSVHMDCNARALKKYASEIETLYHKYPTSALAEPLAKIWYSILISHAKDRLEYAEKIIDLCAKVSDPERV